MIGGLIFVPLSCMMLGNTRKQWSNIWKLNGGPSEQISELVNVPTFVQPGQEGTQHIVLISILKADLNYGYQVKRWNILRTLNEHRIQSLATLWQVYNDAVANKAEWLIFQFEEGTKFILDTEQCAETDAKLKVAHKLPSSVSPNVLAELEAASMPVSKRRKRRN